LRWRGRSKLLSGNAEIQPYRYWGLLGFLWPWPEAHQQPPSAANVPSQDTGPRVTLGEEEISDVSLATFYVFDKENESELDQDLILLAKVAVAEGEVVASVGEEAVASVGEEAVASAEGREAVASAEGAAAKGVVAAEGVVAEAYGLEPA
jgi:hypothetical protein